MVAPETCAACEVVACGTVRPRPDWVKARASPAMMNAALRHATTGTNAGCRNRSLFDFLAAAITSLPSPFAGHHYSACGKRCKGDGQNVLNTAWGRLHMQRWLILHSGSSPMMETCEPHATMRKSCSP